MATKWKKWKNSVGFLAFVLGISLLITGGMDFWYCCRYSGTDNLSEAFAFAGNGEFQDSKAFREFISGKLWEFLAMGTGDASYNNGYWGGGYWDSYEYWNEYGYEYETTCLEEQEPEENTASKSGDASGKESEKENVEKSSAGKSFADRYHAYIQDDKNLLYCIASVQNDRQSVLYTNMDSVTWKKDRLQMPDGYNFYLHFDGEKVEIQKDGAELDIYGDGIYRKKEDWYVPGYKNLTGKPDWKKLDIVVMAVKEPAIYYGSSYYQSGGELYDTKQLFIERHQKFRRSCILMAAGLLLFLLYLFCRKGKQAVMGWIAARLGKIWFECKLLLCLLLPVWMCFGGWIGQNVQGAVASDSWDTLAEETDMYYGSWTGDIAIAQEVEAGTGFYDNVINQFYVLFGCQSGSIVQVLVIFWLFYLFFMDLHQNPGGYRHSLTGKYIAVLNSSSFHQRLSVRVVKRFRIIFALSFAALAVLICFVCFWLGGMRQIWLALIGIAIMAALLAAEYVFQKKNRQFAEDLEKLADKITGIREGNYTETVDFTAEDSDLRHMALELEDIRKGMEDAVEERTQSERMKVELVANVSHDIKTPLTSIISYIQLLMQEEHLPENVKDYIRILDEKSQRLKTMVQDVFSISKAASGQLAVELKELDFGKLLEQTLADMEEEITGSPVTVKTEIPKEPVLVVADGSRMYRVFQNLIGNAIKYSLEGSRVYVTLKNDGVFVAASVKNTSCQELDPEINFAERFTRGDQSRTDGGSGLGLSIAKSFTEACGGTFKLEMIADLFVVTVAFPVSRGGRE